MPATRKYYKSPLYYPDDKDLRDFMRSTDVSSQRIRHFLQCRGMLMSRGLQREVLYEAVSKLVFGWSDLVSLVNVVDLGERKEKETFVDLDYNESIDLIVDSFQTVKSKRQGPEKESYRISSDASGRKVTVEVDYIDIDTSKTPMLQGRPATLRIEVVKEGAGHRITHTNNEHAKKIVQWFLGELGELHRDQNGAIIPINTKGITLADVISSELRVRFFTELSRSMDGFTYVRATNVKVARFPSGISSNGDEVDEADEIRNDEEEAENEEQILRNVILQGINVEQSEHYKKLLESGFFIGNLTWDAVDNESKSQVSFSAGFADPEKGYGFEFKINYMQRSEGGELEGKERVPASQSVAYSRKICSAAETAAKMIRDCADEQDGGVSNDEGGK